MTSSVAQLDSYNLFRTNKPEGQAKPEDSKNAFYKSIDSFKEIGTGFVGTLKTRADKATDSPYDFFNWLTLGITGYIPVGIYEAAKDRSEHMFDSKEKFADWLTLGTVEMAKGAFNPDEAWSADHWLNSLGMVTLLYGPVEKSLLPTGGGGLKPPKGLDSVKDFEVQKPLPSFSTNEGFQFKINNLDMDTPALPQTPIQINFKNEMDRILREKMEGKSESNHSIKDVEVKAVEGTGKTTKSLELSDFTKEIMETKPMNSRLPEKWYAKGGTISIDEKGTWTYTNKEGISVSYPNGYPNFSPYYHPTIKPVEIKVASPKNNKKDFENANLEAGLSKDSDPPVPSKNEPPEGYTWHHHEDGKTMVLVDDDIHDEFKHIGGQSKVNGKNKNKDSEE